MFMCYHCLLWCGFTVAKETEFILGVVLSSCDIALISGVISAFRVLFFMYLRIYGGVVHDFSIISCVFSCDLVIYRMIGANILIFAHIISILSGLCAVYSVLVHHLFLSYCVISGLITVMFSHIWFCGLLFDSYLRFISQIYWYSLLLLMYFSWSLYWWVVVFMSSSMK